MSELDADQIKTGSLQLGDNMTEAQINEVIAAAEKKKKELREKRESEKGAYDDLKEEVVSENFAFLKLISEGLTESKDRVFDNFKDLLDLKKSILGLTDADMERQQTHTFSTKSGLRIIIGHNVIDGYDEELATAGVAKVNQWLDSQTTEENRVFVSIIRDLLRPNKDGVLKASRVIELGKRAKEIGDVQLIDAVGLLIESYQPKKTSTFVKASFKDSKGQTQWLALSMSQA